MPILLLVAAYLVGGIPFGVLLARRLAGRDVRSEGSGNIGATNVARVAGKKLGALTLLLDAAKGLGAVLVARVVLGPDPSHELWENLAGFSAVLGHCFSPYLRLRGGKGVATSFGVFLIVAPWAALAGFVAWAALYALTRISSLGSLVAAVVVPGAVYALGSRLDFYLALATVALVLLRHQGNIRRLLSGKESTA
ncbi:MAG: glycerol-3-phosphate 1-O-acyltransferase [Deltaproteobacteria bacterium]|nr:MAG: glycerol-3-phosphate 1-O-acyltransferase [Deltaproteobacteria bacterium]